MPVLSGHLQVHIRGVLLGQQVQVVQWYRLDGVAFATATVLGVLEAYWNNIKDVWRATHVADVNDRTLSLFGREAGALAAYAEFAVPVAEQQGTRASGASFAGYMPPFVGAGVKLAVGSGLTRPGQKRFWGLGEGDSVEGVMQAPYLTLVEALAVKFSDQILLGAPVATGVMFPEVVRQEPVTGNILVAQDVTGHVVNNNLTTQNSRKIGRGA